MNSTDSTFYSFISFVITHIFTNSCYNLHAAFSLTRTVVADHHAASPIAEFRTYLDFRKPFITLYPSVLPTTTSCKLRSTCELPALESSQTDYVHRTDWPAGRDSACAWIRPWRCRRGSCRRARRSSWLSCSPGRTAASPSRMCRGCTRSAPRRCTSCAAPAARRRAPAVLAAGARHRAPALVVAPHASDPSPPPGSAACPTEGRVFKFRARAEQQRWRNGGLHRPATYIEGLGLDRAARELSRAAGRLRERTRRAMRNGWADTRARVRY